MPDNNIKTLNLLKMITPIYVYSARMLLFLSSTLHTLKSKCMFAYTFYLIPTLQGLSLPFPDKPVI